MPPRPPEDSLTHATRIYDPGFDAPAGEGRQQLIISAMRLTKHRERHLPPGRMPTEGLFAGKRILIKAQALELGANGKRLVAVQYFWPVRGLGAEDGSLRLSNLDKFLERVLMRIPRPGSFELSELIGLNFMATVVRCRRRIEDELHPIAYFLIVEPDCCVLHDGWPSYPPLYIEQERKTVFYPPDLAGAKI